MVGGPSRALPCRTDSLRQRRGTDGRPAHAAGRVRRAGRGDCGVRRNLDRAPGAAPAAKSRKPLARDRWALTLRAIESLIERLEVTDWQEPRPSCQAPEVEPGDRSRARGRLDAGDSQSPAAESDCGAGSALEWDGPEGDAVAFVHVFDTDRRDLERCGYVVELHERKGSMLVVAARSKSGSHGADTTRQAHAQIDSWCAGQILSEAMSPLAALERQLGAPVPLLVESVRAIVGDQRLRRIDSRVAGDVGTEWRERPDAVTTSALPEKPHADPRSSLTDPRRHEADWAKIGPGAVPNLRVVAHTQVPR